MMGRLLLSRLPPRLSPRLCTRNRLRSPLRIRLRSPHLSTQRFSALDDGQHLERHRRRMPKPSPLTAGSLKCKPPCPVRCHLFTLQALQCVPLLLITISQVRWATSFFKARHLNLGTAKPLSRRKLHLRRRSDVHGNRSKERDSVLKMMDGQLKARRLSRAVVARVGDRHRFYRALLHSNHSIL